MDRRFEEPLAQGKAKIEKRILRVLKDRTAGGELLDIGCNLGNFLRRARDAEWTPRGFEPNEEFARELQAGGFDVRTGWCVEAAGFEEGSFAAITLVDVFYYSWHPIKTLRTVHSLLRPGGAVAMRVANKRFLLGLTRMLTRPGPARDARLSKLLQSQFHSIGLHALTSVMGEVGFGQITVDSHAKLSGARRTPMKTHVAYRGAEVLYRLSMSKINLFPSVLIFASKR
jgi:SAM-dependent methyltransferase